MFIADVAQEHELSASIRPNGEVVFGDAVSILSGEKSFERPASGKMNVSFILDSAVFSS
jgi:hypothetical protein